jgi:hypothetical protein
MEVRMLHCDQNLTEILTDSEVDNLDSKLFLDLDVDERGKSFADILKHQDFAFKMIKKIMLKEKSNE